MLRERRAMSALPVNEVFHTIQGEARWTGTPAVFLRLQGCPVGCPWCDTKHTWEVDEAKKDTWDGILAKTKDAPTFTEATPDMIVDYCLSLPVKNHVRHLVITGGEPALYDLKPICVAMERVAIKVQVETSGTEPLRVSDRAWVTVSPKLNMPGGRQVLRDSVRRANEIKMPVGKPADIAALDQLLEQCFDHVEHIQPPIWLQPLSQSPKATGLCVAVALERNWQVSLQTHKYLGVR